MAKPRPSAPTSLTPIALVIPISLPAESTRAPPLEPRDRGVGLQQPEQLAVVARAQGPVERRKDSHRDRGSTLQPEWAAHGYGSVTDRHRLGRPDADRGESDRVDAEHREVGERIFPDHGAFVRSPIREDHPDRDGAVDDMLIRDDRASSVENHARTRGIGDEVVRISVAHLDRDDRWDYPGSYGGSI